jgi:selenocysteine lyase/cysteine desulfurase
MEIFTREELIANFPNTERFLYFASASTGISPECCLEAQERFINLYRKSELFHDPETFRMLARLRGNIADLFATNTDEIALMTNTSDGINTVATGIEWKCGDEILIGDREFPANSYPWLNQQRRGAVVKWIPMADSRLTPELVLSSITPKTKLIAISSVQFSDGYRADLKAIYAICREREILLFVDGIQSAGALQGDLRACCDFFAAGGQKHLLSPYGTGFLFVRREKLEFMSPAFDAWLSHFISPEDFLDLLKHNLPPAPDARRFEVGTLPYGALWGMDASVAMLKGIGARKIEDHNLELSDYFSEKALGMGITIRSDRLSTAKSHIVTIEIPSARLVADELRTRGVVVSVREGGLRFAFHIYNTKEQIDNMFIILRNIIDGVSI